MKRVTGASQEVINSESTQANSLSDPVNKKSVKSSTGKKSTATLDNYKILRDLGEGAYG